MIFQKLKEIKSLFAGVPFVALLLGVAQQDPRKTSESRICANSGEASAKRRDWLFWSEFERSPPNFTKGAGFGKSPHMLLRCFQNF